MFVANSNSQQRVILPIQYLRGVAALMVVWHHARGQLSGLAHFIPWNFGPSGVDLFFVISGFIMLVTTSGSQIDPSVFIRRRIIRVAPLYWLLTLSMVCVGMIAPGLFKTLQVAPSTLIKSLLFIPHFSQSFPAQVWPLLVPGWTLNFEMFFYGIFGLLLFFPLNLRLAALAAIFCTLVAIGFTFGPFTAAVAKIYTSPLLLEFLAGALIAHWWLRNSQGPHHFVSLLSIGVGIPLLVLRDSEPLVQFSQIIGSSLIVIGALNSRLSAWRNSTLKLLGDSSYSLYLTHLFTLGVFRAVWTNVFQLGTTQYQSWAFMLLSIVACSVVGWLTYRLIESPLLLILNRKLNRRH